jgi:hypothetical protein
MRVYSVYYKLNGEGQTANENFIAPNIKNLMKFVELNYPDWEVGTIQDFGTVFDVVDGRIAYGAKEK